MFIVSSNKKYKLLQKVFNRMFMFILLAGLQSCEKDVSNSIDINALDQLVVTSFISPQDTTIRVKLQRSQPAVGRQYTHAELRMPNATVKISEAGSTIELKYNIQRDVYEVKQSLFPILAGKTYTLNVSTPNGWKASASSKVPLINNIQITSYGLDPKKDEFYNLENTVHFKWHDDPAVDNYYHTSVYRSTQKASGGYTKGYRQIFYSRKRLGLYSSDETKEGQELRSADFIYTTVDPEEFPRPYNLHLLLLVTSRDYYLYHRSVIQQQDADGNPFAEPTLLYTNMHGGLGIFAAFNVLEEIKQIN